MKQHNLMTALLCSFLLATTAMTNTLAAPLAEETRPRIGLVLSGGGTKGGAHLGVIKVLEELRIPVDVVAGTSIGAVIGGMYAAGMDAQQIDKAIHGIDWAKMIQDQASRRDMTARRKREHHDDLINFKPGFSLADGEFRLPRGVVEGHQVTQYLRRVFAPVAHVDQFDQLPIPFRPVSADLLNGEMVVLNEGDLVAAIRASMTISPLLAPVEVDGRLLIDGGIVNNLPADVARAMGADILILVDITSPFLRRDDIKDVLSVSDQMINLMTTTNVRQTVSELSSEDILIRPEVARSVSLTDEGINKTIEAGAKAAKELEQKLAKLALPEQAYAHWRQSHRAGGRPQETIARIHLHNDSGVSDAVILKRMGVENDDEYKFSDLHRGIDRVFGMELFGQVDYRLKPVDDRLDLDLSVTPRSWGPSYLQFGLQMEADFANDTQFDFRAAYLQTAVNPLGGEWQATLALGSNQGIGFEWYQPMNTAGSWYLNPHIEYERSRVRLYDANGNASNDLRISGLSTSLFAGYHMNDRATMELGWYRLFGKADRIVGSIELEQDDFEQGELQWRWLYDSLDQVHLPKRGVAIDFTALASRNLSGGSADYTQYFGSFTTAQQRSRYRWLFNLEAGTTVNDDAPAQSQFVLGGFGRLSGYPKDRFRGQNFGLAVLNASREIGDRGPIPFVLGYSAELGQAWNEERDEWLSAASIFAGLDTPIGPVYFATGFAEGGQQTVYLYLGNPFGQQSYRSYD